MIRWADIDNLEDYFITYLLYQDSLSIAQIAKVRNKSIDEVNKDLILAKTELRKIEVPEKTSGENDIIYLSMDKEDRVKFIEDLEDEDKTFFKRKVYKSILKTKNVDDLMVWVWTAGELRDYRFLNILYPLVERNHSNLRRIAYSAISKIGSEESLDVVEMGLLDENPQIRQYCAKALGRIGSRSSIKILENIIKNKSEFEKEYVLRSCRDSLDMLYKRYK